MSASTTKPTSSSKSNASSTPKAHSSTTSSSKNALSSSSSSQNLTKEEILGNTKIVVQGLETLKTEHNAILSTLRLAADCDLDDDGRKGGGGESSGDETTNFAEEKKALLAKSLEMIELGLGEAQVMVALSGHLQTVEAEKKKLRAQVGVVALSTV